MYKIIINLKNSILNKDLVKNIPQKLSLILIMLEITGFISMYAIIKLYNTIGNI
jgi:hypothetical protein